MSTLRIRPVPGTDGDAFEWCVIDGARGALGAAERGALPALPARTSNVQLVVPASDALLTSAALPRALRRDARAVAYALEERTLGEPESQHIAFVGREGDRDCVAVMARGLYEDRLARLRAAGVPPLEILSEILLVPLQRGEWSVVWNGRDAIVRTGLCTGAATDEGDADTPPLALALMLQDAGAAARPERLAVYLALDAAPPDLDAWASQLGVALELRGAWSWEAACDEGAPRLELSGPGRRPLSGLAPRLKAAGVIAAAAVLIHLAALGVQWAALALERGELHERIESRARAVLPQAAIVDPVRLRWQLADARLAAGVADPADFVPLLGRVSAAMAGVPGGALRGVHYDAGALTLKLGGLDEAALSKLAVRLADAGFAVSRRAGGGAPGVVELVATGP